MGSTALTQREPTPSQKERSITLQKTLRPSGYQAEVSGINTEGSSLLPRAPSQRIDLVHVFMEHSICWGRQSPCPQKVPRWERYCLVSRSLLANGETPPLLSRGSGYNTYLGLAQSEGQDATLALGIPYLAGKTMGLLSEGIQSSRGGLAPEIPNLMEESYSLSRGNPQSDGGGTVSLHRRI